MKFKIDKLNMIKHTRFRSGNQVDQLKLLNKLDTIN